MGMSGVGAVPWIHSAPDIWVLALAQFNVTVRKTIRERSLGCIWPLQSLADPVDDRTNTPIHASVKKIMEKIIAYHLLPSGFP